MFEPLEMTRNECEDLLRSGVAGRVALSTPAGPHIIPVNYAVIDSAIVLRTSPYSLLGAHGRNVVLAFEVDGIDPDQQQGWSVVVRGRSDVVTDADELAAIRSIWPSRPWAAGARNLHLRISWSEITGRRLGRAFAATV